MKLFFFLLLAYLGAFVFALPPLVARRAVGGTGSVGVAFLALKWLHAKRVAPSSSFSGFPLSNGLDIGQRCQDGRLTCPEPVPGVFFPITTVTSPPLTYREVSVKTETMTETTIVISPAPTSNTTMAPILFVNSNGSFLDKFIQGVFEWYHKRSPETQQLLVGLLGLGWDYFIYKRLAWAVMRYCYQHRHEVLRWVRSAARVSLVLVVACTKQVWLGARGLLARSRRATLQYLGARIARMILVLFIGTGVYDYVPSASLSPPCCAFGSLSIITGVSEKSVAREQERAANGSVSADQLWASGLDSTESC